MTTTLAAEELGEVFKTIYGRVVPYGQPENIAGMFYEEFAFGAFTESLAKVDGNIPLLPFHKSDMLPVGRAIGWEERSDGLYATFQVDGSPFAQTVAKSCRDEFITGLSVGFVPERSAWSYVANWDPDNGQLDSVTRTKARLLEVSITPTPAYVSAMILAVEAEPRSDQARSGLAGIQHWMRQYERLHQADADNRRRADGRAELAQLRRWLDQHRRS